MSGYLRGMLIGLCTFGAFVAGAAVAERGRADPASYPPGSCAQQIAECRKRGGVPSVWSKDDDLECTKMVEVLKR